jgi:predicted lipid carrier protein YhbT
MTTPPRPLPECPPFVAAALQRLPAFPGNVLLAIGLNAVLARHLPADVAQRMEGRSFRIHVKDARLAFDFGWRRGRFVPLARQARPDLVISATGADFVRMARREEDPDTLFFSRRLGMEGDTELGLVVKNTLDALELPLLELARTRLQALRGRAPRRGAPWN